MRALLIFAVVLLAGCSGGSGSEAADGSPGDGDGPDDGGDGGAPGTPSGGENSTAPKVHWINGTFENVGQCAVYPQAELDRIQWHDLPDGSAGAAYETEVEATVGPAPASVGQTGVCIYFHSGQDGPLGHQAGETQARRGDVPDGATQVAVLTDAAVDGDFTMKITIEQVAESTGAA